MSDVLILEPGDDVLIVVEDESEVLIAGDDAEVLIVGDDDDGPLIVIEDDGAVLIAEDDAEPEILIVDEGHAGPPGPAGPAGGELVRSAGATVLFGQALKVNAASELVPASAAAPADFGQVVGLAASNALTGEDVIARSGGSLVSGTWSWVAGGLVYLGADGFPTQAVPGAGFVQCLGYAASPTELVILIGSSIVLGA